MSFPFHDQVLASVRSLISSAGFRAWLSGEAFSDDDLIILNNSFVERYGLPSKKKNPQYLCFEYADLEHLTASTLHVCRPGNFNMEFKRYSARSTNLPTPVPLTTAVEDNLSGVGSLVFLLIGHLDDTVGSEVSFKSGPFTTLRFVPTNKALLVVDEDAIEVNSVHDPEAIWWALDDEMRKNGGVDQLPGTFGEKLMAGMKQLRGEMHSVVKLPRGRIARSGDSLIRRMVVSLGHEVSNYDVALRRCEGDPARDPQAFADVLRIAYNFASDCDKLIGLIVSICDVKPLLLWATIAEHSRLARSFRELPWATGSKASLKQYQDMVGGARNHAFHDLIRLDRSVHVEVSSVTLQARSLRLFAPYASSRKATENTLEYEDQELVDILTRFTHAPETVISAEFWRKNSKVMHGLRDLIAATEQALVLLHNERVRSKRARRRRAG